MRNVKCFFKVLSFFWAVAKKLKITKIKLALLAYHSYLPCVNANLLTRLFKNGVPIGRISYDINVAQWGEDLPSLFFHIEGDEDKMVSGFVDMDEETATALCIAFNEKHFGGTFETLAKNFLAKLQPNVPVIMTRQDMGDEERHDYRYCLAQGLNELWFSDEGDAAKWARDNGVWSQSAI